MAHRRQRRRALPVYDDDRARGAAREAVEDVILNRNRRTDGANTERLVELAPERYRGGKSEQKRRDLTVTDGASC